MTREDLLKKSLENLREIARIQGVKSYRKYRKAELVDIIMNGGTVPSIKDILKNGIPSTVDIKGLPDEEKAEEVAAPAPAEESAPASEPVAEEAPEPSVQKRPVLYERIPNEAIPQAIAQTAQNTATRNAVSRQETETHRFTRGYVRPEYPQRQDYPQQRQDYTQQRQDYSRRQYNRGQDYTQTRDFNSQERYNGNQNRYYNNNSGDFRSGNSSDFRSGNSADFRSNGYRQSYTVKQNEYQQYPAPRRDDGFDRVYVPENEDQRYRNRQESYYNAEYGTSNPAVPEMLEGGECGDAEGILEIVSEGYGFLRCENYLPSARDVYISNAQIRRFRLKTGDLVTGKTRPAREGDKFLALLYITAVNGYAPEDILNRKSFEELVPIFPNERLTLESKEAAGNESLAIRLIDLMAPIGKGQRGMIVSQPKAGKTTLLKNIANGIANNYPDVHLIVLLIDERPEEVTDMQRSIKGEVVYSTFDEMPERHTRVAEMVMERSMRLVEQGKDVVVLMDSITRLARAYNLTITTTGKTLSGGMDPGALHKPKRFFGAARNIEGGGSLTVIATALVETGSRMDDMVYEEFKGTGNMEIHLDRKLSERRIFPAIDIYKSGTRRDELLLSAEEREGVTAVRRMLSNGNTAEVTEQVIGMLQKSETNDEFLGEINSWISAYEKQGYSASRSFLKK